MRILHVITGLNVGGAERSLLSLISSGLSDYADNYVISLSDFGIFGKKIADLGVPVYALGLKSDFRFTTAPFRFRKLIREIEPDLIQGWMYHGNLAAVAGQMLASGKPSLVWNVRHSLYDISAEKYLTQRAINLGRLSSKRPASIVYNSNVARMQHEKLGFSSERALIIPNGFDTDVWKPSLEAREVVRAQLGLENHSKLVGFVGRYHPMKDIPTFLQAIRTNLAADPKLHCVVIGRETGPDNPALAGSIAVLPAHRVHFLDQRDKIDDLLPALDVLCLSSAWGEGFPNVIGEAMASGVPCVSTDIGDSRLVVGRAGRIVRPRDPAALADAISEILSMKPENKSKLNSAARARIINNFAVEKTVSKYISMYEGVGSKRNSF